MYDEILIDQGTADDFLLGGQLLPEDFEKAASSAGQKVTLRRQEGFGHDYYFIAAHIQDHIKFHAEKLRSGKGN